MAQRIDTNLSVHPYYDDNDPSKQYVRILFVPQRAVQVRELNQLQAMQQEQVSRFADHVFKDGAVVDGVAVTYVPKQSFVYVQPLSANSNTMSTLPSDNVVLVSSATGVRAVPRKVVRGFTSQYPYSQRIYLDYVRTGKDGSNNDVPTFLSGETITVYRNQSVLGTLDSNNVTDSISMLTQNSTITSVTGTAYALQTTEGIIYQKGYFLEVPKQFVLVNELGTTTGNKIVGFTTQEAIIDEDGDASLVDNANGTENSLAPGAHRLKLSPELVSLDKNSIDPDKTFYPIVEFDENNPVEDNTRNEIYNNLGREMAERIYEESGDYVISPFTVESQPTSNVNVMKYVLSPGVASVRGHRVQFIGTKTIEVERSLATRADNAQIVSANYGNYIIVDDIAGLFNADALETVQIYDAPQNALTNASGAGAAATGTLVGTATVRAFTYDSGTKGTASARYRLYVTNIKMNSGKSFATDAKSIVSNGAYGNARADIVLSGTQAKIYDSGKEVLYFPFGIGAVKRLTDANGTNDSQYVLRDSTTATLQSNGYAVFTTNAPYAGGVERLNNSVGTLSDSAELNYDIALTAAAYTSNLTGTVAASASNVLTGTSTLFNTQYSVGDYIRFSTGDVRRVTAITNATSMQVHAATTVTANTHAKYWPQGHVFNLTGGSAEIAAISNTQFSVQVGTGTLATGSQTVRAVYPILRTQAVASTKLINKDRYVKIDLSTAGVGGTYNLGLVDVLKISAVYVGTTYSDTNPDRKAWFTLNNGQTPTEYGHAQLVVKPSFKGKLDSSTRLLVKLDHFTANSAAGGGFFSVDSYPIIREGEIANATNIAIGDVYNIGAYDFRDVVDFRPQRFNTANSATSAASATVNPTTANTSYDVTSAGSLLVAPDQNFQADIEYYLPRYDLLTISKTGDAIVRKGEPALKPKVPMNDSDTMIVASVFVPAYPSLTTREAETAVRNDIKTTFNILTNRRYTMRDIGVIDQRVTRLEYYATLSALEQAAKDLVVPDENGLDRFKNGIFADTFNTDLIGRTDYMEYKTAIDRDNGLARPRYRAHSLETILNSSNSTSIQRTGNHLTLPYTSNVFIDQPYASKFRNCTESVWKWIGSVKLFPSYTANEDTTSAPAANMTIDLAAAWEDFADTEFGTDFGEWRTTGSRSTTSTSTNRTRRESSTTTTTTTTTNQSRVVTDLQVGTTTTTRDVGTYVTDISLSPYMSSTVVSFTGTGFKPNTRLYPFFDESNVAEHCAPGTLSGITAVEVGKENRVVNRTGDWGTPIVSDANGNVAGQFRIPANTFRTGDRVFVLTNVDNWITGADAKTTSGEARYTASSIAVTTQTLSLTTIEPTVSVTTSTQSRSNTSVVSSTTVTQIEQQRQQERQDRPGGRGGDPIAQSFTVTMPHQELATGMIVDRIGVYFRSKDPSLGITCKLMEMSGGYPNITRVIAEKYLTPAEINTSANASIETIFDFDSVAYLTKDGWYAFMLQPDGNSPEYEVWTCQTGGIDVLTQRQIFSSPYVGVLFVSANQNTWTAFQNESMKFNLYRARFTASSGVAHFFNESDDYFTVDGFIYANSSVAINVGDVVYKHVAGTAQTSNTSPFGIVQAIDTAKDQLVLDSSNGKFRAGDTIQIHRPLLANATTIGSSTLVASATIETIDNFVYSAVVPRFASSTPGMTSLNYSFRGTSNTYALDGEATSIVPEIETEFYDAERLLVSKSNEDQFTSGAKTSHFFINLSTQSDYVSPVIDLRRKTSLLIENIVNNDLTDEHTQYGAAQGKYVSPIITLAEGQDAEDIELYLSAYRPSGTDVHVYFKALNIADTADFDAKVWTKMNMSAGVLSYSSSSDPGDVREYKFSLPTTAPVTSAVFRNAANFNVAEYIDGNGVRYIGFKRFAIKIVMTSETRLRVPHLHDVRALALQV